LFGFNPSHKFEWINAIQGQIDQNEGKVESVKKERIDSLYQAPPTQPSFDNDQFDFDPRGSVAVAPAFQQQQHHQSFDMGGAPPHQQQQHHQSSAFSALPEPTHEEPADVPILPPPPGMKRESGVVARDPFAAGGNDPFASLGGPAPVNPYAPQGFAQPDPFGQPQMLNPHASVINPYGQAPINPYAPPQQQPINPHASVINPYAQQQPNPYAPNPYGQPQLVVDPRGSVYNPPPLQPKPLPTPGGGSGFGGGIPGLPPKPQYTPLAQQQQQPDPFASLLPALPAKPLPSKAGPPAGGARDPFGGDDDFESFARRSGQQPGPHDSLI
jgi:hypothetical protein